MDAIVIDLKDFKVRTPDQVVRVFYELFSGDGVELRLWEVFRVCAVSMEEGNANLNMDMGELADLMDHLLALVKAVEGLRRVTRGRCVICGRGAVDG